MWFKLLIALLVVAGIATWMQKDPYTQADRANAEQLPEVLEEAQPFVAEGIIIRYQASDLPTYYLLYETKGNSFVRKELRFTDSRGCNAQSGDLPCVYLSGVSPLPVSIGTHVRVTGVLDAQRIRVESLQVVPDGDGDYSVLSGKAGDTFRSGDIWIRPDEIYAGGGCEVMLGCFKVGIPRVTGTLADGDARKTISLVPGLLETVDDGVLVLLWADEASGTASYVIAHGKSR